MKLATFTADGRSRVGVVLDDEIADVSAGGSVPADLVTLLTAGDAGLDAVRRALAAAPRLPLSAVHLEPPVQPRKYLAIGLNYAGHVGETGRQRPEFPIFFNKQSTCVTGPYDPIHLPRVSSAL